MTFPFSYINFLLIIFLCHNIYAQDIIPNRWDVDSLIVVDKPQYNFTFPLNHTFQKQTLYVTHNNVPLVETRDYIFLSSNIILFQPEPEIDDTLRVQYRRLPFNLKSVYTLFTRDTVLVSKNDSSGIDTTQIRLLPFAIENPFEDFGSGLQKSGSIMRGVNIGTNRDLTLNSGLNLELSGQLTEDVEIIAALSDESTPLQPEGNTQTLEEVDQVFIQFKSPYVDGTVGDINIEHKGTEFGNFSRKLTGLSLLGKYNDQYVGTTFATTRGFFNRMSLLGQEGNQGPYQLTGKNGEREIIVLAGTENVFVNGTLLLRGESNDYIIEYANGQITFTNNLLVTSESRIEVDFEYFPAIQRYSRSALGGLSGGSVLNNKLKYNISFYQEKDNIDQAIGTEDVLTNEEKEILKNAGDDFRNAFVDGATFVGVGMGNYILKDTIMTGQTFSVYEYVGRNLGEFNIIFTSVGKNMGDYKRDRTGKYSWVGKESGEYLPVKLIPLPQKQQLTDIHLQWKPSKDISLRSEYAFSNLDKNSYSTIENGDNVGSAFLFNIDARNMKPAISNYELGSIDIGLNTRIIENNFQSIDRFNQTDFQRYWNVLQSEQQNNHERSIQLNSHYKPIQEISVSANIGTLEKNNLQSNRFSSLLSFKKENWFRSNFNYEVVKSTLASNAVKNNWSRIGTDLEKDIWLFTPQLLYQSENRKNETLSMTNGFRFDDYGIKIGLLDWEYLSGFSQYNERADKIYDVENQGTLVPQAITKTQRYRLELQNVKETSASLEFITREKDFNSRFESIKQDTVKLLYVDASVQDTVWQDRETNLAELRLTHSRWKKALSVNLQYRISTEQTALREKVYLEVDEGRGNLRYDQDLDEYVPDPDGNYILFILPSGDFEPVTKLESSLRLNYDPSRYWRKASSAWQNVLLNLSGSSYFRVEEETKEKDLSSIYLLNLNKFQKDLTLRGTLLYDQDIFIMKKNRDLNFRLLYSYRDDLFNQFLDVITISNGENGTTENASENENRLVIERGFRTDWRVSNQVKSQSEIRKKITKRNNKSNTSRNRNIDALLFNENLFYKPHNNWEYRLNLEYGTEENTAVNYPLKLQFGLFKLEGNYIVAGKGRVTADYEYQLVDVNENPLNKPVPFEMARGRKEGISKKWQFRAEYTISKNILFTLLYRGRDEAGFEQVIHTGQAEVRAFF